MLHFYFPLPFLIIALLSTVIKYQIAFKIGTILGTFLLPITTYWAFKVLKFKFPLPIIAAGFTVPFLLLESYSIYGGNILSTLAGEFGYSLSFSMSILFLALLYRDVREQKFRVSTGVLLGLIALSHIVTTITIIILSTYYVINRLNLKRFAILAGVFGLGFALSAFWGLPFIAKIGYTAHMQWGQLKGFNELLPSPIRFFLVLSIIGIIGAISKKDNRMYPFLWAASISASLFFLLPPGRLWNGRLLPYFYFFMFIWAAYGVWFLRRVLAQLFFNRLHIPKRYADYVTVFVTIAFVLMGALSYNQVAKAWINWNYSGFEGKKHWDSFAAINRYIKDLPEGRVMVEHSSDLDAFGTPRAFELLPYFANHPTMEGTLMEASHTAPFHFVNQAELSKEPSHAILGVQYPEFNMDKGVKHLQFYNIRYFLALTEKVKDEANKNKSLKLLKNFDVKGSEMKLALYEVYTDGYVTIPKHMPVIIDAKNWRDAALEWYSKPELFDTPLVDARHAGNIKGKFKTVRYGSGAHPGKLDLPDQGQLSKGGTVAGVKLRDDEIVFSTTAIGVPHLIKVSYFPNWKVEGADGPYLAAPSIMMVIPRQKHVRLYYGNTWSDIAGAFISITGWLFVIACGAVFARRKISGWRQIKADQSERLVLQRDAEGSSA